MMMPPTNTTLRNMLNCPLTEVLCILTPTSVHAQRIAKAKFPSHFT